MVMPIATAPPKRHTHFSYVVLWLYSIIAQHSQASSESIFSPSSSWRVAAGNQTTVSCALGIFQRKRAYTTSRQINRSPSSPQHFFDSIPHISLRLRTSLETATPARRKHTENPSKSFISNRNPSQAQNEGPLRHVYGCCCAGVRASPDLYSSRTTLLPRCRKN